MSLYNEELIQARIDAFRNTKHDEVTILFDMDNTLYRFSIYKQDGLALQEAYTKGFYKNLPIFPEAPYVVEALQKMGMHVGICTSLIDSPYCKTEKEDSLWYYFPMIPQNDIIMVPEGQSKIDHIKDISNTILIDDWHGNIMKMYEQGGIAIKKSYSEKQRPVPTVHNLVELFPVLHDLKCFRK